MDAGQAWGCVCPQAQHRPPQAQGVAAPGYFLEEQAQVRPDQLRGQEDCYAETHQG